MESLTPERNFQIMTRIFLQNRSIFRGRGCRIPILPSTSPVSSTITLLRHHRKRQWKKSHIYILHPPNHLISADIDGITGRVATLSRYSERFKCSQCKVLQLLKQRKYLQCNVGTSLGSLPNRRCWSNYVDLFQALTALFCRPGQVLQFSTRRTSWVESV